MTPHCEWDIDMRRGITLLEVLVLLVVCLCAAGLAVMLLVRHRETPLRENCKANLKHIGEAFHAYDEMHHSLPPARIADGYSTWAVLLAPHMVKENPLNKWRDQESYFAQPEDVRQARLLPYFCPTRQRLDTLSQTGDVDTANQHYPGGLGDYACVVGDGIQDHDWTGPKANGAVVGAAVIKRQGDRILEWQSQTSLALLDKLRGKSYTLLAGEKHVPIDHFGEAEFGDGSLYNGKNRASFARLAGPGFPLARKLDEGFNNNFGSYHKGICLFLFADGSVRPLSNQIDDGVLGEMARRGE